MLNSMQVPLPPSLEDTLKKELEVGEICYCYCDDCHFQLREQSASELCCNIKAWGTCNKLGCTYAHTISNVSDEAHMIPPHIKLPSSGTVKVSGLVTLHGKQKITIVLFVSSVSC